MFNRVLWGETLPHGPMAGSETQADGVTFVHLYQCVWDTGDSPWFCKRRHGDIGWPEGPTELTVWPLSSLRELQTIGRLSKDLIIAISF